MAVSPASACLIPSARPLQVLPASQPFRISVNSSFERFAFRGFDASLWPLTLAIVSQKCYRCRSRLRANALPRRLVSAAAALASAVKAPSEAEAADSYLLRDMGMTAFSEATKKADVDQSVQLFDRAVIAGYPLDRLWQRGLSLYYAERFADGAEQFRRDVKLNPDDTEESIWAMLCETKLVGFEEARKKMLKVEQDPRPVMRTAYALFRGKEEAAARAALEQLAAGQDSDQFYASLYLGLFAEAKGNEAEARGWLRRATASSYARDSGDYMADLAKVHVVLRGWNA